MILPWEPTREQHSSRLRQFDGARSLRSRLANAPMRTVAGIAGRVIAGIIAAVLLGGAVLVLLAYYGGFHSTWKPLLWR